MNKIEERDMRKCLELNKKDKSITELHEELIRERQIINEKIKEIERLNNIINELEKHFEFLKMNSTGGNKEFFEDILKYIRELKKN